MTLQDLAQRYKMWKYFFELSDIPRPSRSEELACEWVIQYAKKWNLQYQQDDFGNITVQVPANRKELESFPLLAMQGHLDMVCEKDDIVHDFYKDPLKLRISDDEQWVTATGTTLGADNGIAIAYQMAFMDPECEVPHGPLEMIYTLDEETGLNGAAALGEGMISARYMINIDNAREGMCCIGCAGGRDYLAEIPIVREAADDEYKSYELVVSGLAGGHSGSEIYDGRASAIKLGERVLSEIQSNTNISVASIEGGDKRNAIARSTKIVFYMAPSQETTISSLLENMQKSMRTEMLPIDKEFSIVCNQVESDCKEVLTQGSLSLVLDIIRLCPHGVLMCRSNKSYGTMLSTNLASVRTFDTHMLCVNNSRFSNQYGEHHITRVLDSLFKERSNRTYSENGYVAWEEVHNSPLEKLFSTYYEAQTHKPTTVDTIHGGLECGIIKAKVSYDLDVISIGPEINFLHSPKECMHIVSTENLWHVLCKMLENAHTLSPHIN